MKIQLKLIAFFPVSILYEYLARISAQVYRVVKRILLLLIKETSTLITVGYNTPSIIHWDKFQLSLEAKA